MKIDNFKVKQSKSHYSCSIDKGIMSSQAKASGYEQQLQIQKLFDISSHVLTKKYIGGSEFNLWSVIGWQ